MTQVKKKVVCIEDEPAILDLIRLILGRKGLEVIGATADKEGLETIRRVKPDLVLLNMMTPGARKIHQQMKADDELKHIPVFVVPAKGGSIDDLLKRLKDK